MNFTIIVPCYNEEAVLPETTQRLAAVIERLLQLKKISSGSILYVDDGSADHTWTLIEKYAAQKTCVKG